MHNLGKPTGFSKHLCVKARFRSLRFKRERLSRRPGSSGLFSFRYYAAADFPLIAKKAGR